MRIFVSFIYLIFFFAIISCHKSSIDPIPDENANFAKTNIQDSLIVDGYLNKFAFNQSETASLLVNFKRKVDSINIGIYDINEKLVFSVKISGNIQKISNPQPSENGYGYVNSVNVAIPKILKSGLYYLGKKIPFIIKNTYGAKADFVVVHPSHNDIAYNYLGGKNFYNSDKSVRIREISLDRPWLFAENGYPIPLYKWLLEKGFNVDFICDDELQEYSNISNYKLIIIAGHSEYWTRPARENFDKFVNSGKNALILSGNSMYWQTRLDLSRRKLICYKYDAQYGDPVEESLKTDRWEAPYLELDELNSIGLNFYSYGGIITHRLGDSTGFKGFKIIHPEFEIFNGLNFKPNSVLEHNAIEYDGAPVSFKNDATLGKVPIYNNSATNFYKIDILGWDYARSDKGIYGGHFIMPTGYYYNVGMAVVLKPKVNSGVIINMSSSNWCNLIYEKPELAKITDNAISFLLKNNDYNLISIK